MAVGQPASNPNPPAQYMKVFGKTTGLRLTYGLATFNAMSVANAFRNLGDWFTAVAIGGRSFNGYVNSNGAVSTGTITFSSFANNDTITINGTTFTGKTSGATGNQFNIGGSDTLTAVNAVAAINASATAQVANNIFASNVGAVITITCKEPGTIGNLCTLAISAHGSVSGANLTGGTDNNVQAMVKGI